MMQLHYDVTVEAPSKAEADQAIAERLNYDEDYGFPYEITYRDAQPAGVDQ